MRNVGSEEAISPRDVRRSEVQEMAKRGVRIGWTRGSLDAACGLGPEGRDRICVMSARVSANDDEVDGST